jgi:hypothetical protein
MIKHLATVAVAALMMGTGSPALALTTIVNFTVTGGLWDQAAGTQSPFGMTDQPSFTGSLTLDSEAANPFVAFTMVTGTKSWTLADLNEYSGAHFNADDQPSYFWLSFFGGPIGDGNIESLRNVSISDGPNWIRCRGCITIDGLSPGPAPAPVPEPATWAMMIIGFGLAGSTLRRRYAKYSSNNSEPSGRYLPL